MAGSVLSAIFFLKDEYTTLKKAFLHGKLAHPFLASTGVVAVFILAYSLFIHSRTPIKPGLILVLPVGFIVFFMILPAVVALGLYWLRRILKLIGARLGWFKTWMFILILSIELLGLSLCMGCSQPAQKTPPLATPVPERAIQILVDDFIPQPYQGDALYDYNRLEGDRGALNNSNITWGQGMVTATVSVGNEWGGIWMSLNHPIRERQSINFMRILPSQILPKYQSQITGISIVIAGGTASRTFRVELKDSSNNLQWSQELTLNGDQQVLNADLPRLAEINQLVLLLDQAVAGDFVTIDQISLVATSSLTDTPTIAFVWSYGMLLNNWNPASGLVRDKANDAGDDFDAIQATGSLAAATVLAEQVGVINPAEAISIVEKISDTLLNKLPRNHGLWPHWVKGSSNGSFEIVQGTEWSSVDTVIAAIGLLDARQALGLPTAATEQLLREIEWDNLVSEKGISHGYGYDGRLIPYAWDVFGGESWLVELAYASATGNIAPLPYPSAPTANGSGFIDELAWIFVKPPSTVDIWGNDWTSNRITSAERQISYYTKGEPSSCFAKLGLFGLSAAEVPDPAELPKKSIYQAFGVGGQFEPVNDGTALLELPTVVPHYSAMIAMLNPQAAIKMWDWLIVNGFFSPLNNVESMTFPSISSCNSSSVLWNQLKGSWNLSLQTLGWGRYLAELDGKIPVIWQATRENPFLRMGYFRLAPNELKPTAVYIPQAAETPATPIWDRTKVSLSSNSFDAPIKYAFLRKPGGRSRWLKRSVIW